MNQKKCPFDRPHQSVISISQRFSPVGVKRSYGETISEPHVSTVKVKKTKIELELDKTCISEINKIPLSILQEAGQVVKILYDPDCTEEELIKLLEPHLGKDQLLWGNIIQTKYLNEQLGIKIFKCFKPILPTSVAWLDSNVIYDAMQSYGQDSNLSFEFYYPCEAGKIFTAQDLKIKNQHGFVINTGKIVHEGSHWVSVFVDLIRGTVEYFDSFGGKPNTEVRRTVNSIRVAVKQVFTWADIGDKVKFTASCKQTGGVECGMFAIFFMVARISGKTLLDIARMSITDTDCSRLRKYFFNYRRMDTKDFTVTDFDQPA